MVNSNVNRAILGIAVILLTLLFPSYAVSLGPNQNFAHAANQQQPKPAPLYSPSGTPLPPDKWNLWLKSQLGVLSTPVALHLASSLGVDQLGNKPINQAGPPTNAPRPAQPNGLNTPIYGYYYVSSEPSIAFNPRDPTEGYAVFATSVLGCRASSTFNGGSTWDFAFILPLNSPTDSCADPVVRWSPDGSHAYFVYLSMKASGTNDLNVLTDSCPPLGCDTISKLWSGTAGLDLIDRPWIDVHEMNHAILNTQGGVDQSAWVYVTATIFDSAANDYVLFKASSNHGATWPVSFSELADGSCPFPPGSGKSFGANCNPLLTGVRVIGGMYNFHSGGGDVLVCWYNSDSDGVRSGHFDIQCDHSPNNGATWFQPVSVAHNVNYELPFYLCPNNNYEAWWTGMFPSIAITPDGRAHVAFAASSYDYKGGSSSSPPNKVDCGNIEYVRSNPFDYDNTPVPPAKTHQSWLPVKMIAGGALAQGFPTLVAQERPPFAPTSLGYRLYLFYYDAKNSPATCAAPLATNCYANILYDIYMRTSNDGGNSFSADTRITDQSSLVNFNTVTDYIDATATSHSVWVIWPDHANELPCPVGLSGCPTTPPPILHFDTPLAIYAQQVSSP